MSSSEAVQGKNLEEKSEKARILLKELQPESVGETMDVLFREDPELTRELFMSLPNLLKAHDTLVVNLAGYLQGLPVEERTALIREVIGGLDGKTAAEATNAASQLWMDIHRENPELAAELFPALEEGFASTDFGKLREAVTALIDYSTQVAEKCIELSTDNPIIIANLIGILPPLINGMIKVVSSALENIDLPPEIIASALFNIMQAVDTAELGKVINGAASMANALHEGNLVLGGDDYRFRAVFSDFAGSLLANVDTDEVASAVVALGEDTEVIISTLTELLCRDPELHLRLVSVGISLENILIRAVSNSLLELQKMPDEAFSQMGEEIKRVDAAEVGRMLNSFVGLSTRLQEANPSLRQDLILDTLSVIDREQFGAAAKRMSLDMVEVARKDPGLREALEPEAVAEKINQAMATFNSSTASGPGAISDYLSKLVAAIDTEELEVAAGTVTTITSDVALASAGVALALLKPAVSVAWRMFKSLAGKAVEKLKGYISG